MVTASRGRRLTAPPPNRTMGAKGRCDAEPSKICVSPRRARSLGACNFWVIPIPIPLGATTLQPVPVEERPNDDSRDDGRDEVRTGP